MSDPRPTTPYTTQRGAVDAATASVGPAAAAEVRPDPRLRTAFLTQAFVWMFVGLLLSAGVAFVVQSNERLVEFAASNYLLLIILQFGIVFGISFGINRISASIALLLFFVYAASLGLTLGIIVASFSSAGQQASVVNAFVSASAIFAGAAIYGAVTKRSLASLGGILFMGLIGLIVAMVLNLFLGSSQLTWIISIVGVLLFTALTAYDVQRIQNGQLAIATGSMEKAAVLGALTLYLDFLNLFLFLLRLFGSSR